MCEKFLRERNRMSEACETVAEARRCLDWMLLREARGPGDLPNAMRRLEARYGLDFWDQWRLRYRPPRDLLSGVRTRLLDAYCAETERQARATQHERRQALALRQARRRTARGSKRETGRRRQEGA